LILGLACLLGIYATSFARAIPAQPAGPANGGLTLGQIIALPDTGDCTSRLEIHVTSSSETKIDARICGLSTDNDWVCTDFSGMNKGDDQSVELCHATGDYKVYSREPKDDTTWELVLQGAYQR
jgi:hypothetical protein